MAKRDDDDVEARPFLKHKQRFRNRNREAPSRFVSLPGERWRPIPTAPGYEASNLGRVRSWRSAHGHVRFVPKLRVPIFNARTGRFAVSYMGEGGKLRTRPLHQLVLEAFRGLRPDGHVTRHLDGNPTNNRLRNLAWGTPVANEADKVRHGTSQHGERNHQCKLTDEQVREIRASRELGRVLAARYDVRESQISRIRNGRRRGTA